MGRFALSACLHLVFYSNLFSGDFRFHLGNHLRQQFFAFLLAVGIDIPGVPPAIGPFWGEPTLPKVVVKAGYAARSGLADFALIWIKSGPMARFSGLAGYTLAGVDSRCTRLAFGNAPIDLHCRRPPHIIGDVGVDVQRGAAGDVADDGGQRFHVHAMF